MAFLLVSALSLAGCATQKSAENRKGDRTVVISSIDDLASQHARDTQRIDQLEQRVNSLEQQTQQQNAQIEAISQALENAQIRHSAPSSKSAKSPSAAKLVEKIGRVEASIQQATSPEAPVEQSESEKNIYTAAYLALKSSRYDEASLQFAQLLEKFPKGEYTDQAWFWLGESLNAQHKRDKALKAYDHVVRNYPDSVKYDTSLLRMGEIYRANKRYGDARAVLGRLLREHPESPSAATARRLLLEIDSALKPKSRGK